MNNSLFLSGSFTNEERRIYHNFTEIMNFNLNQINNMSIINTYHKSMTY